MELHWQKFQVLTVQSAGDIRSPDGAQLKHVEHLQYLGAQLTADANMSHELGRKIGEARRSFTALRKVWSHSSLTRNRKLRIYASIVESKLLYGLSSACFTKAQLRRLDGFQNRCLRMIIGVKPSYISRISNRDVLTRAGYEAASTHLLFRQLQLFGQVLRADPAHPLYACSFAAGMRPATERYVRRVGRPHKEFVPEMSKHAACIFGSMTAAAQAACTPAVWERRCRQHVFH